MRVVLQIVDNSNVKIDGKKVASINKGYLLLVGVFDKDNDNCAIKLADKIAKLRIFKDDNEKTNLSLKDVNGSILSVSQFTLCADTSNGNRPSFTSSAKRDEAIRLYDLFNNRLKENGFVVETGKFGADMKVELVNNGPFTLVLDAEQ